MSDTRSRRVAVAVLLVLVAVSAPATAALGSASPGNGHSGAGSASPAAGETPAAGGENRSTPGNGSDRESGPVNGTGGVATGQSERANGGSPGENARSGRGNAVPGDDAGAGAAREEHARGGSADTVSESSGRSGARSVASGHPRNRSTPAGTAGATSKSDADRPPAAAASRRGPDAAASRPAAAPGGAESSPGRARGGDRRNDTAGSSGSIDDSDDEEGAAPVTEDEEGAAPVADDGRSQAGTAPSQTDGPAAAPVDGPSDDSAPNQSDGDDAPARDTPARDGVPIGHGGAAVLAAGAATTASSRSVETASASPATFWMQTRSLLEAVRVWLTSLPRVLSVGAYSRHADSDALDHEARERLYEIVAREPGVNVATLAERSDLARSTARYHLRVLERDGALESANIRGKRRYFRAADGEDDAAWHAVVRDDTTAAVIEAIDRHEPASGSTLAAELDRDPSTISHHLDRLEEAGAIERERDGRAVVNRLTAAAREALTAPPGAESADRTRGSAD